MKNTILCAFIALLPASLVADERVIEPRFVEIPQDNLRELSFDWLLGPDVPRGVAFDWFGKSTPSHSGATILPQLNFAANVAATPKSPQRLTPQRIAELAGPTDAGKPESYKVEVSGLHRPDRAGGHLPLPGTKGRPGVTSDDRAPISAILPADHPQGVLECIREFRFPSEFHPPKPANEGPGFVPTFPSAFESVNTGWTIRLSAKRHGKLIVLSGVAEYIEADLVPAGYGPIAEPIYSEKGKLLSPNVLNQPKVQTTTTRFHIFAVPGEPYEVALYRGDKPEKHTVTVTVE